MIRLHIVAEGQTEEEFVNSILVTFLAGLGVYADVRCVETSRRRCRIYRGGMLDYGRAKRDLARWIREDDHEEVRFTTMFDLYALPVDFPEFEACQRLADPYERVAALERAFEEDMGCPRFVPYIQLHEFEALLLTDPSKFAMEFIDCDAQIRGLAAVCADYDSPELIDDGATTAPSKRIIEELPEYEGRKASAGPLIAGHIGLERIRAGCPHFDAWLRRLEALDRGAGEG